MSRKELQRRKFKMVLEYQSSGKTQMAFVREAGISLTGFRYWLNKYRSKDNKAAKATFVEVVAGAPPAVGMGGFDIIFPNGVRINLGTGADGALLGKIIKSW
jgi:hypothetical protein